MSAAILSPDCRDAPADRLANLPSVADALPDGGRIDRSDREAMEAWVGILGVHEARILTAVAVVGANHEAVRDYLEKSAPLFGPEI